MARVDTRPGAVGESTRGYDVKGEFDALRKVARLASEYLAAVGKPGGAADTATLQDLRSALDDLECRYPYTLRPRSLAGGLHALVSGGLGARERRSTGAELPGRAGVDEPPERF